MAVTGFRFSTLSPTKKPKEGRVLYVDASGGGLLQMLGVGDWDSLPALRLLKAHRGWRTFLKEQPVFSVSALKGCFQRGLYLPCLDDRPRSNIPFARYRFYRHILEEMARKG
jgi:hypothetical protein